MAIFPKQEAEVAGLAAILQAGLAENAAIYPAPPVNANALRDLRDAYLAARSAMKATQAAAKEATVAKCEALRALTLAMKDDLGYAEITVHNNEAKLQLLGWGATAARKRTPAPGQPRGLEAPRQGEGWLFLEWKAPLEGGEVASYRIQHRLLPEGVWTDAGMSVVCGTTLSGQQRGREWEYRVIAVNKAGEGAPSNTVMAVL